MSELLALLGTYSLPAIALAGLVAGGLYLIRETTARAIGAEFDRRARAFELSLERRSRFEETILIERYETISDILARLTRIASDLNRRRHGTEVDGLMRGNDIVPLTEVFELLASKRHVVTERFHPLLGRLAGLLIQLANMRTEADAQRVLDAYQAQLVELQDEMRRAFGLDAIAWTEPGVE